MLGILRLIIVYLYDLIKYRSHNVAQVIGQLIAFVASYKLLRTRITAPPTIDAGFEFKEVAIY